jgi:hypothetical protein
MAPAMLVAAAAAVRPAAALHAAALHGVGPAVSRVGDRGLAHDRPVMARARSAQHPSVTDRSGPASAAGRDRAAIVHPAHDQAAASGGPPALAPAALIRAAARGRERHRGPRLGSAFAVSRDRRTTPRTKLGSTIGHPGSRQTARGRPPRGPGFPGMVRAGPAVSVREAPVRATSGPATPDRVSPDRASSDPASSNLASSRHRSSHEPPRHRSSSQARS